MARETLHNTLLQFLLSQNEHDSPSLLDIRFALIVGASYLDIIWQDQGLGQRYVLAMEKILGGTGYTVRQLRSIYKLHNLSSLCNHTRWEMQQLPPPYQSQITRDDQL